MKIPISSIFFLSIFFLCNRLLSQSDVPDSTIIDAYLLELENRKFYTEHTCTVVFKDVNIVDIEEGRIKQHRTIFITDGKITKTRRRIFSGRKKGAKVIDAKGKFLAPALTDFHVHFKCTNRDRILYLLYGVTTIRNMAGMEFHLQEKKTSRQWNGLSPDLVTAGPAVSSQAGFMTVEVRDTAAAHRTVNEQKNAGYDFIKTENNLSIPCLIAVLEEAKKLNMRVAAELPDKVILSDLYPFASILTIESLPEISKANLSAMRTLGQNGMLSCPELVITANASKIRSVDKWKLKSQEAGFLSLSQEEALNDLRDQHFVSFFGRLNKERRSAFKKLHEAGIGFLAGTESGLPIPGIIPGAALHDEMNELVLAGLTPLEAIRCATINGEKILLTDSLDKAESWGHGMVLLSGNPLDDIKNYRAAEGVLFKGAWMDAKDLDEMRKKLAEIKQ
jgi:imidazolonepropionase-like amidohydrolase